LPAVAVAFVALTGGMVASFAAAHDEPSGVARQRGAATTSPADAKHVAEAKAFYDQTKLSLSPLLQNIQRIKVTLRMVLDETQTPSASLAEVVAPWAEDAATARDLVGRLIPPSRPEGDEVRELYRAGTMLYLESVRDLARMPKIPDADARHEEARSGLRIYGLADRVMDQAKRLLDLHGDLQLGTQTLPAEVPDFVGEHLQPGAAGPVAPEASGFAEKNEPRRSARQWSEQYAGPMGSAMAALRQAAGTYGAAPLPAATLEQLATELDAASAGLGAVVPDTPQGREGSVALRLALLVQSESLRVAASPVAQDGALPIARRLRLIGDQLWSLGAGLLHTRGATLPEGGIGDPGLDAALLRQGGVFAGSPPPLAPGDPPDKGLPGGLKLPDPNRAFTG
jgi:hypothetical protein